MKQYSSKENVNNLFIKFKITDIYFTKLNNRTQYVRMFIKIKLFVQDNTQNVTDNSVKYKRTKFTAQHRVFMRSYIHIPNCNMVAPSIFLLIRIMYLYSTKYITGQRAKVYIALYKALLVFIVLFNFEVSITTQ